MLDFVIIGAQGCGIGWMVECLAKHPEIHFPHGKELSFWNFHYPKSLHDPAYKLDINWYRSLFLHWDETGAGTLASLPVPAAPNLPAVSEDAAELEGEGTPMLVYERGWFDHLMAALDRRHTPKNPMVDMDALVLSERSQEASVKLGDASSHYCAFDDPAILPALRAFAPDVRILYIVRHPVERAWVSAQMAIARADMCLEEASDAWCMDHFRSHLSLKHGDYATAITQWRAHFPAEQMLVVQYEEARDHPQRVLARCCAHLGLEDADYFDKVVVPAAGKISTGLTTRIRPSLVEGLETLYAQKIHLLYESYGLDYRTHIPA